MYRNHYNLKQMNVGSMKKSVTISMSVTVLPVCSIMGSINSLFVRESSTSYSQDSVRLAPVLFSPLPPPSSLPLCPRAEFNNEIFLFKLYHCFIITGDHSRRAWVSNHKTWLTTYFTQGWLTNSISVYLFSTKSSAYG